MPIPKPWPTLAFELSWLKLSGDWDVSEVGVDSEEDNGEEEELEVVWGVILKAPEVKFAVEVAP